MGNNYIYQDGLVSVRARNPKICWLRGLQIKQVCVVMNICYGWMQCQIPTISFKEDHDLLFVKFNS